MRMMATPVSGIHSVQTAIHPDLLPKSFCSVHTLTSHYFHLSPSQRKAAICTPTRGFRQEDGNVMHLSTWSIKTYAWPRSAASHLVPAFYFFIAYSNLHSPNHGRRLFVTVSYFWIVKKNLYEVSEICSLHLLWVLDFYLYHVHDGHFLCSYCCRIPSANIQESLLFPRVCFLCSSKIFLCYACRI